MAKPEAIFLERHQAAVFFSSAPPPTKPRYLFFQISRNTQNDMDLEWMHFCLDLLHYTVGQSFFFLKNITIACKDVTGSPVLSYHGRLCGRMLSSLSHSKDTGMQVVYSPLSQLFSQCRGEGLCVGPQEARCQSHPTPLRNSPYPGTPALPRIPDLTARGN